jgi:multiple sugar transport system substrate-binding protein
MMRRRMLILALAGLILIVASTAGGAAKVKLTHFNYYSHGDAWYQYLLDRAVAFGARNPGVEVEVLQGGGPGDTAYVTKFTVMQAGGAAPNITDFHPALGATQIVSGAFTDLRPFLSRSGINLARLVGRPVAETLTAPNGAVWALPADIYPVASWFNEDLFDQAGLLTPIQLGKDWTWEQALSMGRKLTKDADGDGIPEIWGIDRMGARWYIWVHQAGGKLYDRVVAPTKSLWNTPEVARGLDFPRRAFADRITAPPGTPNVADTYFWKGKTAIDLVDGPGVIGAYMANVPFRWNIAPQVRGPVHNGSEIAIGAFQIVAETPHQEEAWKWLQFISLDTESALRFVEMTGRAPSLMSIQGRYGILNKHAPSNVMAFFEVAAQPETQINYVIPQQAQVNTVVNPKLNEVWAGRLALETALEQIHTQLVPIFAE